jgi:hypothetical protein
MQILRGIGFGLFLVAGAVAQTNAPAASPNLAAQRALIDQYCVGCHNEKLKVAGLMLDKADINHISQNAETWEKVVRKLRAGLMPPSGIPRPDPAKYEALTVTLEDELDRGAAAKPKLAAPGVHRVNRTQYANAIKDLLGLDIDPSVYLPADDTSYGFDNIASGLQISPAHVEGYVGAAAKISRLALGHESTPSRKVYHVREDYSQEGHVEGLPFGTRGGMLVQHYFPVDGEYTIAWDPIRTTVGSLYGGDSPDEKIELSLDGERLKLYKIGTDVPLTVNKDKNEVKINVKAGQRTVGIAFLANTYVPNDDLNKHYKRSVLDDNVIEGFTFSPQVSMITISGPTAGARPTDTPSRRKILTCTPAKGADEVPCAKQILNGLAKKAYRRPLNDRDTERLMSFYQSGRNDGDFESGIERGLELILAHPEFVFRSEDAPGNVKPGEAYRISDLELASRLSFFLWSTVPDDELINLASQGKLHDPATLERQIRRMIANPKSYELAKNFAGQWWDLRMLTSATPEGTLFPDFDDNLRRAFRTEAEMFFESIMREDRGVVDLLTADYTFVNERLAAHYGIPNVYGSQFRRVTLGPEFDMRRGLLGKGSIQLATSLADRTSPVQRGKWVLTNILGSIPPDPPPNVPALKPPSGDKVTVEQTMRQRMEEHRNNPACASCHRMMDPIGFALESFDAIGKWRTRQYGQVLDASGQLTDGTKINGVGDLRQALLKYSPQFVRTFTEKLMIYALGRGVDYEDMPMIRSIVRDSARNNYRFSSIVMGIVKSPPFQMNRRPDGTSKVAQVASK